MVHAYGLEGKVDALSELTILCLSRAYLGDNFNTTTPVTLSFRPGNRYFKCFSSSSVEAMLPSPL